jgi:putative transposase
VTLSSTAAALAAKTATSTIPIYLSWRTRCVREREKMIFHRGDEEVEIHGATDAFALQQAEGGTQVGEVCRKMGISEATFYRWKQLYGGLMPSEVKKLRQLEEENTRLRRVVADLPLDKEMLQEVIRRKL